MLTDMVLRKSSNRPRLAARNIAWEVIRLKGSPAAFVGIVYAPDKELALEVALDQFDIAPSLRNRLLIRRA